LRHRRARLFQCARDRQADHDDGSDQQAQRGQLANAGEGAEGWARLLRGERNIGDFTRWKEHDSYQKSFDRLMRDLRVETSGL
jgi:hypothetical protein